LDTTHHLTTLNKELTQQSRTHQLQQKIQYSPKIHQRIPRFRNKTKPQQTLKRNQVLLEIHHQLHTTQPELIA
jgi:hypothetical protein